MKNKLLPIAALIAIGSVAVVMCTGWSTVEGGEMAVIEDWNSGVQPEPVGPRTYFYNRFTTTYIKYNMRNEVYVMDDKAPNEEFAEGRKQDSYLVQSKDQQNMRVSMTVQWHRDPRKLVTLHKAAGKEVEERLIRPVLLRVVKDEATLRTAIEAYSGKGLVELQDSILKRLRESNSELSENGVIVDQFTIRHIELDKKYTDEIVARQIAIQGQLRAVEQTKLATAEAEKAKAEAQADYERNIVIAKQNKEKGILDSEMKAQQAILAAKADAERVSLAAKASADQNVLIAKGQAEAGKLQAASILAIGQAEAEATKLKLQAYSVPGADYYAKIQIAESMAKGFSGIKGYIPEKMGISVLSGEFEKGLNVLAPTSPQK